MKILVEYPCGCQLIDAKTKYTKPKGLYSLQSCKTHIVELKEMGYQPSNDDENDN
jgi:hypothetical protein